MNEMTPEQLAHAALTYIEAGKKILAHRVVTILALLATVALYGFATWQQTWQTLASAGMFSVLVLWPIMRHELKTGVPNG